jgi:hypothetical protein
VTIRSTESPARALMCHSQENIPGDVVVCHPILSAADQDAGRKLDLKYACICLVVKARYPQ